MLSKKELIEISERMGEAVHNAWMEKRKEEKGWHAPENCTQRFRPKSQIRMSMNDSKHCDNCHPCMRPYSELPDSEKELDRQYPKLFLQILDKMGYEVVRQVSE